MILIEKKMNLFEVDDKYYLTHCISADYALGAGIAVEFAKKFHLKTRLISMGDNKYPSCIFINPVFNLVTKKKYWNKPTYESLQKSLEIMKEMIKEHLKDKKIYLAMPKIGCGLDRLQWGRVREIIEDVFEDMDIEILVCSL